MGRNNNNYNSKKRSNSGHKERDSGHYIWAWRASKSMGLVKLQANQDTTSKKREFETDYGTTFKMVCNIIYVRTGNRLVTTGFYNPKTKIMQIPEISMVVNCKTNCFRNKMSEASYRYLQNKN